MTGFREVSMNVYRDVPEIQNFVATTGTILGGPAINAAAPRVILYDDHDGTEFNMFTMNVDGTSPKQVTEF